MDLALFSDDYIPSTILYRHEELTALTGVIDQFIKDGQGLNYMVFGYTGAGKTLLIKKLQEGRPDRVFYISAARKRTALKIVKDISGTTYNEIDKVLDKAIEAIKATPRVLIIDELNQLRDPAVFLDYLNTIYRETRAPIILISNKRDFAENIADDARLTLFFRKLTLKPYNAEELKGIIQNRIALLPAEYRDRIQEGFLNYVCAIAAREGSARLALAAVHHAILTNDYSFECAQRVNDDVRFGDWKDFFESLSGSEKDFLKLLVEHADSHHSVSTEILYKDRMFQDLSPSRLSNLISIFDKQHGLIEVEFVNKGRGGGRYRLIKFASESTYRTLVMLFESSGIKILFDNQTTLLDLDSEPSQSINREEALVNNGR